MGMFVLIIVIGVIGYIVQDAPATRVQKYSEVPFPGGLTGAEVAEKMLRDNKIHNVKITHVSGQLTGPLQSADDDRQLERRVYSSRSVAAAAVAAHECGHAIQHAQGYAPLALRSQLVPYRAVLLAYGHVRHHHRPGDPGLHAECTALLDRRGHDRRIGSLLAHHPAGWNTTLRSGPSRGSEQPHARRSTARTSQGSPGLGCPHLPGSRLSAVASLLYYVLMIFGRRD